ncbi:MAG: VTT domain-containing protein [Spirochaetes bacterium]|nr:VTT domain-containing protein [Spirochaetota bacterium]
MATERTTARGIVSYVAFPLFVAAILTLMVVLRRPILAIFASSESVRSWVLARGASAPLVFVGLQVLQVVVFVIPGEIVQVAGGFLFGVRGGVALSSIGILAGSLVNFTAGRVLGRPFVESVFGRTRVERLEKTTESGRAAASFFLLFVIPGIPKDALCYVAGMGRLSFPVFMLISGIGRLPGILGSTWMGSAAFDRQYNVALAILAVSSALFFIGLFFKEKITSAIARFMNPKKD